MSKRKTPSSSAKAASNKKSKKKPQAEAESENVDDSMLGSTSEGGQEIKGNHYQSIQDYHHQNNKDKAALKERDRALKEQSKIIKKLQDRWMSFRDSMRRINESSAILHTNDAKKEDYLLHFLAHENNQDIADMIRNHTDKGLLEEKLFLIEIDIQKLEKKLKHDGNHTEIQKEIAEKEKEKTKICDSLSDAIDRLAESIAYSYDNAVERTVGSTSAGMLRDILGKKDLYMELQFQLELANGMTDTIDTSEADQVNGTDIRRPNYVIIEGGKEEVEETATAAAYAEKPKSSTDTVPNEKDKIIAEPVTVVDSSEKKTEENMNMEFDEKNNPVVGDTAVAVVTASLDKLEGVSKQNENFDSVPKSGEVIISAPLEKPTENLKLDGNPDAVAKSTTESSSSSAVENPKKMVKLDRFRAWTTEEWDKRINSEECKKKRHENFEKRCETFTKIMKAQIQQELDGKMNELKRLIREEKKSNSKNSSADVDPSLIAQGMAFFQTKEGLESVMQDVVGRIVMYPDKIHDEEAYVETCEKVNSGLCKHIESQRMEIDLLNDRLEEQRILASENKGITSSISETSHEMTRLRLERNYFKRALNLIFTSSEIKGEYEAVIGLKGNDLIKQAQLQEGIAFYPLFFLRLAPYVLVLIFFLYRTCSSPDGFESLKKTTCRVRAFQNPWSQSRSVV